MSETRRDQLIQIIEREFIGPDPIDWPGMTQSDGEEILKSDPPRTRYIAGVLFPRETYDADVDSREGEAEPIGNADEVEDNAKDSATRINTGSQEFLEEAEELINRSNDYKQSAISLTVAIRDQDSIRVCVSAGKYTTLRSVNPNTDRSETQYPRTAIEWCNAGNPIVLPDKTNRMTKISVDDTG